VKGFIHSLDARTAFIGVVVMSAASFLIRDLSILLLLLTLMLVLCLLHREMLSMYSRGVKGLLVMVALVGATQSLFTTGEWMFRLSIFGTTVPILSIQGLTLAGRIMARVGVLVMCSLLFSTNVEEGRFLEALSRMRVPYPVVFSVNLVLRALPRMFEDVSDIRTAYLAGMKGEASGYLGRWTVFLKVVRPLFVRYVRSAQRLGISLELRGFTGSVRAGEEKRVFTWLDIVCLGVLLVIFAFSVYARLSDFTALPS